MEFCSVSVFMEANRGRGKIIIAVVDSRVVDDVIIVCFQWRDNRGGAPPRRPWASPEEGENNED